MKIFTVKEQEAGQRSARYLMRCLPNAGKGFLYKMFRKKNITLNGMKMTGSEVLAAGDEIRVFFSDETLSKFMENPDSAPEEPADRVSPADKRVLFKPDIIYEDREVLIVNKPQGLLTQKAEAGDISLNDVILSYLIQTGSYDPAEEKAFRPAAVNRLDRNTSGLVVCGKSVRALQELSKLFRERDISKQYLTVVLGNLDKPLRLDGWLVKDTATNQVKILQKKVPGAVRVTTGVRPLRSTDTMTLAEIDLITGKTHQIRAHLASIGHPVGGDPKYGDPAFNRRLRNAYGVRFQLLHACRLSWPENLPDVLAGVSGKTFTADPPAAFQRVIRAMGG